MSQPDLFGKYAPLEWVPAEAFARRTDPIPSHEAAVSIATAALEGLVADTLRKYGPLTTEQIADITGASLVTVSPRMKPLEGRRVVVRDGKRKNRSGVSATVWRLV